MRDAYRHFTQARKKLKCLSIKEAAIGLLGITQSNFDAKVDAAYDSGVAKSQADAAARPALGIEIRAALAEFSDEIGCPDFKKELGLTP